MNHINDEVNIDLKDFLGVLFAKIIRIALCVILAAAIAIGYAVIKNKNSSTSGPSESSIRSARAAMSPSDAETVDRVYKQYVSYTRYKAAIQKYFDNFLFYDEDTSDYIKQVTYLSMTSTVYGSQRIFTALTITPEMYDKIREIIPDEEGVADVYDRVWIYYDERNAITILNDEDSTLAPQQYMLSINVMAKTREQCVTIEKIVEDALFESLKDLQKIDPQATLTVVGDNYLVDNDSWIIEKQNDAIYQLNSLETMIRNFESNQLKNLSDEQRHYFDILVAANAEQPASAAAKISKKKMAVVGAFGGFIIACGFIAIKYLFSQQFKTKKDISTRYSIPVLNSVTLGDKKYILFDKLIKHLRDISDQDIDSAVEMISSDIGILMDKSGSSSLYLVETAGSDEEMSLAEKIKCRLQKNDAETLRVDTGKPLESAEELKKMADADNVVLLIEREKTEYSTADKYYEQLERYGANLVGSVVSIVP